MAAPLGRDALPEHWSYGVCGDGRVFFVDDETHTTTWLHPRTGEPVNSGHMIRSDLPRGWEEGFTDEGAGYFINHNQRTTTFRHPVTGQVSSESMDFILQEQPGGLMPRPQVGGGGDLRPSSTVSETSTAVTSSTLDSNPGSKGSRTSRRVHSFGKRDQAIKRNPNVPVVVRGWLYKQDSSGMRLWKRKWFVLADYCLFYYKDSREESVLGSIPLPSYVISPVEPEDHISRKYAFKASHTGMRSYIYSRSSVIGSQAEHGGMRTYFFSADTQEDLSGWVRAMNQAALMQNHSAVSKRQSDSQKSDTSELPAAPQTNHVTASPPDPESPAPETPAPPDPAHPLPDDPLLELSSLRRDAAEPCCGIRNSSSPPPAAAAEAEPDPPPPSDPTPRPLLLPPDSASLASASAPASAASSRAPSRAAAASSTLPPGGCLRNGGVPAPMPMEPNGIGAGTYQRATLPPPDPHRPGQKSAHRSPLEQVEHWVKVQRTDKGPPSRDSTLSRHSPPPQPQPQPRLTTTADVYQTLPKTPRHSPPPAARHGEYKYAQDRLSHFRLHPDPRTGTLPREGGAPGGTSVWQLYEWQQRHQYRHGSPTAPLYTPAPDYPYGPRPPSSAAASAPRSSSETPRCVSVPPSPSDIPPPGPPPGYGGRALASPRRPHTPAERVTVLPQGGGGAGLDGPLTGSSPRRATSQLLKTATIERRSMPPSGYITHTVSAPSLHGKTADDTYLQLKKDLEYLDLKVVGGQTGKEATKPVKVAESDVDVKLSRLCEQDKVLQDLEARISSLKEDKDKLERVLDMSHQQMEEYQDQPAHTEKIAYQQRLLQEDVVHIRAQISRASTEMAQAWEEYSSLDRSVEQLRTALQNHVLHSAAPQQEKAEIKRELWRIEDVIAGLSSSKANYKVTIDSILNPERKLVPSVSDSVAPSQSATPPVEKAPPPGEKAPPLRSFQTGAAPPTLPHNAVPNWAEDEAPPRPPLPCLYDYEDTPPVVPPLPREASVIRHMSVRGLKRQSDERKRDRESGHVNGDCKVELRSYLSEPELPGMGRTNSTGSEDYQTLPSKGLSGSSSRLIQSSNISSYVTLRRGATGSLGRERPRSALERLYSDSQQPLQCGGSTLPRGRMSAEEQLERMKRHQRALVRERKRNLSSGPGPGHAPGPAPLHHRSASSSRLPPPSSSSFVDHALQQEERQGAEGQSDEGRGERRERIQSDEWMTVMAMPMEPLDYDLDISRELSKPRKVPIPERYVESDPDEPLTQEELEERRRNVERIKNVLAKSSVQNIHPSGVCLPLDFSELDSALQQQERIMSVSALATEASRKSKQVAARAVSER